MYTIGDHIVHPLHGAGIIERIETKTFGKETVEYYVLKIPVGDMDVLVPKHACEAVGIRLPLSKEEADQLYVAIATLQISKAAHWGHRYRENMIKLKSGDLLQVAMVLKCLETRRAISNLATSEQRMLQMARQIFLSEMVLSQAVSAEEAEKRLTAALGAP